MHALYVASVFLHLLAATAWIGGMAFLVLVVVPWLKRGGRVQAGQFLRETGERFRWVGWVCFCVLLVTGTFQLWFRGVRWGDLFDAAWLATDFGRTVAIKLAAFAVVVAISAYHDFVVGPRAVAAMEAAPEGAEALRLRKLASRLGRVNALLALVLLAAAVMLVRGVPR